MRAKIVLLITLLTGSIVFAQSTCQTRVDAHQKATTPQRVEYCLTPETYPVQTVSNPELIYAQVSSNQPVTEEKQKPYTSSNPYFNEDKYTITRGYVETSQFPTFQNAIMSEQEMAAQRRAWLDHEASLNHTTKPALVQTSTTTTVVAPSSSTKPAITKVTPAVVETKAGIARRSAKPKCVVKQVVAVQEETTTTTVPETSTVSSTTVQDSTLSTQTTDQPDPNELGLLPNNPYAQPTDLETIPYGDL